MAPRYDFKKIEAKWRDFWRAKGFLKPDLRDTRRKFYYLNMFPYPSGEMHVGHGRNYILGDAYCRYLIMRGYNVLNPMGYDAFGLPAENAAIERWCPGCETVLANEQVVDGECERCGTPVTKKKLTQWFFKITAYAEELLRDLDKLEHWPERVKTMQRNWIGRSEGALIRFPLVDSDGAIEVFTTRPDTIYGATYMVLAPEHPTTKKSPSGWPTTS